MTDATVVRVVVTRPELQAAELIRGLTEHGYGPVVMPLLDIQALPVSDAGRRELQRADVVVVTSPTGAHHLVRAVDGPTAFPRARVAAVGRETRAVLERGGVPVDVIPPRATGASLAEALAAGGIEGAHIVLARARCGRPEVPTRLRAAGAEVSELPLYASVPASPDPERVAQAREAAVWTVTSPKIVDAAIDAVGVEVLRSALLISIGPTTSAHARARGLEVAAEAADQSADGLIAALLRTRPPTAEG